MSQNKGLIRVKGLHRTGLYMGYYTFKGVKRDCYIHLFHYPDAGRLSGMIGTTAGESIRRFASLSQLKELINLYPER